MTEFFFVEGSWPLPEIRVKPKNEQEVSQLSWTLLLEYLEVGTKPWDIAGGHLGPDDKLWLWCTEADAVGVLSHELHHWAHLREEWKTSVDTCDRRERSGESIEADCETRFNLVEGLADWGVDGQ